MNVTADKTVSLELTRRFDAPPERVFDAWVSKEWGEWLPPQGARCVVSDLDPRVGGRYRVRMSMADGRTVEISGVYREVVRPKKLVLTWFADHNKQETTITVTFEPDGIGTLMHLRQDGFADAELRDRHKGGFGGANGSFDKLAALLAKGAR